MRSVRACRGGKSARRSESPNRRRIAATVRASRAASRTRSRRSRTPRRGERLRSRATSRADRAQEAATLGWATRSAPSISASGSCNVATTRPRCSCAGSGSSLEATRDAVQPTTEITLEAARRAYANNERAGAATLVSPVARRILERALTHAAARDSSELTALDLLRSLVMHEESGAARDAHAHGRRPEPARAAEDRSRAGPEGHAARLSRLSEARATRASGGRACRSCWVSQAMSLDSFGWGSAWAEGRGAQQDRPGRRGRSAGWPARLPGVRGRESAGCRRSSGRGMARALQLREAEVGEPRATCAVEQHVGGLDIAVQDAMARGRRRCADEQLDRECVDLRRREATEIQTLAERQFRSMYSITR